jgi:hypothetical protein
VHCITVLQQATYLRDHCSKLEIYIMMFGEGKWFSSDSSDVKLSPNLGQPPVCGGTAVGKQSFTVAYCGSEYDCEAQGLHLPMDQAGLFSSDRWDVST